MKLTYGQLELTLTSHLRVHPDKVSTLRSRIKQLQRLQFPPGVNVGRGAKMEYGGEHLLMLVTVFELISIGLPAQTACNLVKQHWAKFAAGYALAAIQGRTTDDGRDQVLAVLCIHSLYDIQVDPWFVSHSEISICDESAAIVQLRPKEQSTNFTRLFISLGNLLVRVLRIATEQAGVTRANNFDESFHDWLPKEEMSGIHFKVRYPDRSNLAMRQHLHGLYGNDPESFTPEGEEEARQFRANDFSDFPLL